MGVIQFLVYPEQQLDDWPEVRHAYMTGYDGHAFPCRLEVDGNLVRLRRQSSDSGKFHVAWPVPGFGRQVISTSSLREQEQPYLLSVELARGKISQIRDQTAAWEMAGMSISDPFRDVLKQAQIQFAHAASSQDSPEEASRHAIAALEKACAASELLAESYVEQRLSVRRRRLTHLPVSLGCNLSQAEPEGPWTEQFKQAFEAAVVPIEWRFVEPEEGTYNWDLLDRQVDWCLDQKLVMRGGPLIDLSESGLPEWLSQWEHDFQNFTSFVSDFVETAISQYTGKIRIWDIAARINTGGALSINEEKRLALVAKVLETARHVDEESQMFISIDQPWGQYQSRGKHRLTPLQFVDALMRSGIRISGINLEIAVGYRPRGTAPRDLLDFSRLIDVWSTLGLPLHVTVACPSSMDVDAKCQTEFEVDMDDSNAVWDEEAQRRWVDLYLPLLMSKQTVTGLFWNNFTDAMPHDYPNAGLLGPDGQPKPAYHEIVRHFCERTE